MQTGTIHQCNFGTEEMKSGKSKLKFCINIVIEIENESVLFCNNWPWNKSVQFISKQKQKNGNY